MHLTSTQATEQRSFRPDTTAQSPLLFGRMVTYGSRITRETAFTPSGEIWLCAFLGRKDLKTRQQALAIDIGCATNPCWRNETPPYENAESIEDKQRHELCDGEMNKSCQEEHDGCRGG